MSQTISAVLITKNEEAMLAACLESVKEADEIIVFDTGSTDGTLEIARRYTDKVFSGYQWEDDFAKARNLAKAKATGDWILSIDADEQLACPFSNVREAVAQAVNSVTCRLIAADNGQMNYFPRLFRNTPEIPWVGAAHNYPNVIGEDVGDVAICYGYSPAHRLDPDRTLRILEKEAKDPAKVRERFYLGREYFYRNRYEDTVITLGLYVQQSRFLAEKAEAFLIMGRAYWAMGGMGEDARDAVLQALKINPNFREACLFMAEISGQGRGNSRWEANAKQWMRMAESATNEDVLFVRQC
jgi:glycosyltransferase involved in cell wall biosynthesis